MPSDLRIESSAAKRELTVYDTPETRSPEEKGRDQARHFSAHPFLYYLSQFVPGLRPPAGPAGESPQDAAVAMVEAAASPLARFAGLDRLLDAGQEAPELDRQTQVTAADLASAIPAFAPFVSVAAPPPGPAEAPASAVPPAEIPRIVFGQVDRLLRGGEPAARLVVQLDPPHLGKVELAVTYAQQRVSVNVVAATQQAKEHLDLQLGHIRAILGAHQLAAGELKVVLASESGGTQGGGADQDPGRQPQRYRRRRRPEPAGDAVGAI